MTITRSKSGSGSKKPWKAGSSIVEKGKSSSSSEKGKSRSKTRTSPGKDEPQTTSPGKDEQASGSQKEKKADGDGKELASESMVENKSASQALELIDQSALGKDKLALGQSRIGKGQPTKDNGSGSQSVAEKKHVSFQDDQLMYPADPLPPNVGLPLQDEFHLMYPDPLPPANRRHKDLPTPPPTHPTLLLNRDRPTHPTLDLEAQSEMDLSHVLSSYGCVTTAFGVMSWGVFSFVGKEEFFYEAAAILVSTFAGVLYALHRCSTYLKQIPQQRRPPMFKDRAIIAILLMIWLAATISAIWRGARPPK